MAAKDSKKDVLIACKLPNGLVIEHPNNPSHKVELNGRNKSIIVGVDYGLTTVDAEFATAWFAANKEYAPVKSCAIFMASNVDDATAIGKEMTNVLTGFEGLRTDGKDTRASNVKTRTEE